MFIPLFFLLIFSLRNLFAVYLLSWLFVPEAGGSTVFRIVSERVPDYTL
jgi:hypothetical protein